MSEFHVEVVRVPALKKHPNADSLSLADVNGYPVIVRTEDWKEGDKAVYVPVDAICPIDQPRFSFLGSHPRIKAKRLRGIFSMGLLVPADEGWEVGQNVQTELGIIKYDTDPESEYATKIGRFIGPRPFNDVENEHGPDAFCPKYTDIEGLRKYRDVLVEGESVVLTEKIHGANARFIYTEGRLWVASRNYFKRKSDLSMWWQIAERYELESKLSKFPGLAIYGEVFGNVQDLKYDTELDFRMFDAFGRYWTDLGVDTYFDWEGVVSMAGKLGLKTVPVLYEGPWTPGTLIPYAEGPSTIAKHVREGFVVRPVHERYDHKVGRVILKMIGEGYLLRKEAA